MASNDFSLSGHACGGVTHPQTVDDERNSNISQHVEKTQKGTQKNSSEINVSPRDTTALLGKDFKDCKLVNNDSKNISSALEKSKQEALTEEEISEKEELTEDKISKLLLLVRQKNDIELKYYKNNYPDAYSIAVVFVNKNYLDVEAFLNQWSEILDAKKGEVKQPVSGIMLVNLFDRNNVWYMRVKKEFPLPLKMNDQLNEFKENDEGAYDLVYALRANQKCSKEDVIECLTMRYSCLEETSTIKGDPLIININEIITRITDLMTNRKSVNDKEYLELEGLKQKYSTLYARICELVKKKLSPQDTVKYLKLRFDFLLNSCKSEEDLVVFSEVFEHLIKNIPRDTVVDEIGQKLLKNGGVLAGYSHNQIQDITLYIENKLGAEYLGYLKKEINYIEKNSSMEKNEYEVKELLSFIKYEQKLLESIKERQKLRDEVKEQYSLNDPVFQNEVLNDLKEGLKSSEEELNSIKKELNESKNKNEMQYELCSFLFKEISYFPEEIERILKAQLYSEYPNVFKQAIELIMQNPNKDVRRIIYMILGEEIKEKIWNHKKADIESAYNSINSNRRQ